jgi:hypothetical protein
MKNVESTFQSNIIAYIGLAKFVSSLFGYALRSENADLAHVSFRQGRPPAHEARRRHHQHHLGHRREGIRRHARLRTCTSLPFSGNSPAIIADFCSTARSPPPREPSRLSPSRSLCSSRRRRSVSSASRPDRSLRLCSPRRGAQTRWTTGELATVSFLPSYE